jgi:hypothetical protein
VVLFNPRRDVREEHLRSGSDGVIEALTPTGRATVAALKMNRPLAIALRREALAAAARE